MEFEVLKKVGLSTNEIKVYLALLKLGENLASKISNETNLNRSLVYKILEDLIKEGFVGYVIKENRKYFNATSPNKLIDIIKDNEREIKKILPDLLNLKRPTEKTPEVEIYSGKKGMETMLEDVLRSNKEILVLGAKSDFSKQLIYYHPTWHKRRVKSKINLKVLFEYGQEIAGQLGKLPYTEIRYLPKKIKSKIMIAICKDKTLIELWFDHPFTILIEDSNVADSFRQYFNLLWNISKS